MHHISMYIFIQILIYTFYSLNIAFAYCSVPFAFKLLYNLFRFHTIHPIICIIVHTYSSFIICNFAFDFIYIMLGITFYASQPINHIFIYHLNLCIQSMQIVFIISFCAIYSSCIYYLNKHLISITQPIPTSAYPPVHLTIGIL